MPPIVEFLIVNCMTQLKMIESERGNGFCFVLDFLNCSYTERVCASHVILNFDLKYTYPS